jgi:hypothetical protein
MSDLTLVVVGKDWPSLRAFRLDFYAHDTVFVDNEPPQSLASIGNRYLNHMRTGVLGLVHADCVFGPGAIEVFERTASEEKVCGIVGVTEQGAYQWAGRIHAPAPVLTMDSCSVFFRKDLGLRFDEELFDSFHCHVEDLCMQAHAKGIPVVVPNCDAGHTGVSYNNGPWRAQYQIYRDRLTTKWGRPIMTT